MSSNANDVTLEAMRLSTVRGRQICCVADFHLAPEDESRLKNMGICVGRRIEVLQVGDPLIVKVSGANVGVARRLASGIEVRIGSLLANDASPWPKAGSVETDKLDTDKLDKDRPLEAASIA